MTARLFIMLMTIALLGTPAFAADINPAGAEKLKAVMENFIANQKKNAELDGQTKISYEGNVLVEPAGDYYAVTLPYTKVMHPDGSHLNIGMISINASPSTKSGQWKMRVAIPTPITLQDAQNADLSRINIGSQDAAGLWDESLQNFTTLNATYKNITMNSKEGSFSVPEALVKYDFKQDKNNKWSGPGSIVISNLEANSVVNQTKASIAKTAIDFSMDRYDSNAINTYREKAAALAKTVSAQPSLEQKLAIYDLVSDMLMNSGNGMKMTYNIEGMNLVKSGTDAHTVTLPKLSFGLDMDGFLTGKANMAVRGNYDGLSITPPPSGYEGIIASQSNVDITINSIPFKDIVQLGRNTLAAAQNPQMSQMAGISFMFKVPALLSQAGTFATIKNTRLGNSDYEVTLDGTVRADIAAANSMTADAKSTFRGLLPLLARVKKQAVSAPPENAQKLQGLAKQLETYKQYAKEETPVGGVTKHSIDIQMNQQGQTLLNGKPLGASTAPAPAAAAPVPPVTP